MDKKEATKGSALQHQSLAEMLGTLVRSSATVVRDEIELVIQRFREKVNALQRGMLLLCSGVLFAFAGVLCVGAAAIIGLSLYMSAVIAALIVGAVFALTGVVIASIGYRQLQK
jgi:VIT1/CCC1 family predicted Fe2+/Mn2+ transporter